MDETKRKLMPLKREQQRKRQEFRTMKTQLTRMIDNIEQGDYDEDFELEGFQTNKQMS